jgi:hypothetical protein
VLLTPEQALTEADYIAGYSTLHIPIDNNNHSIDFTTEQRVSQDNIVDLRGKDYVTKTYFKWKML